MALMIHDNIDLFSSSDDYSIDEVKCDQQETYEFFD